MTTKSTADKACTIIALGALALVSQGCSFMGVGQGNYTCPGGVDGVRCLSARQVYQATETSDYVKTVNTDNNNEKKDGDKSIGSTGGLPQRKSQVAVPTIEQPVPIRTQAKVMRIWMVPWEDDDGDLHADGYLYTEIENRRWNLGEKITSPNTAISPLTIETPLPANNRSQ